LVTTVCHSGTSVLRLAIDLHTGSQLAQ